MAGRSTLRVLFVVAAGPRIGYGHLVRCRSLARALGVPPVVVVRGSAATRRRAGAAGWRVVAVRNDHELRRLAPHIIVVDDPRLAPMTSWVRRARRVAVPVATVHDLGIAAIESDLVIDGSVYLPRGIDGRFGSVRGPSFAILDPRIRATRERLSRRAPRRVLIALGGGPRFSMAARLASAIAARPGGIDVRVAGGFSGPRGVSARSAVTWVETKDGLADELSSATVAILAGGVTLYEACALGAPAVAVALTRAQHLTVRAMARHGAVIDGGALYGRAQARTIVRVACEVQQLLADPTARRRMALNGRRLVDGRGAARVAARLRQLPGAVAAAFARNAHERRRSLRRRRGGIGHVA